MSFIMNDANAKIYAPGYFLAQGDENCVRETMEVPQTMATTVTDGSKYVPMGTLFPSNDSNCVGIIYEDVDVTSGNMPGSVVTKGIVYEDKLPIASTSYDSVTVGNYVSPKDEGWYESDGEATPTYTLSTDTTANGAKTYYKKNSDNTYSAVTVGDYVSPKDEGWYESDGEATPTYTLSTDTKASSLKTYYARTDSHISTNAKNALIAKGFKFITSTPTVTRPY